MTAEGEQAWRVHTAETRQASRKCRAEEVSKEKAGMTEEEKLIDLE